MRLKMRGLLIGLLITILSFGISSPSLSAQDLEQQTTKLEQKISKKFSKTFCNSTGFGISYEGALRFALGETKGEFSKNQLVDKVDIENLKEQILADIGNTCYYFELTKSDLDGLKLDKVKK